jgi:predicted HTH domain antitoxin
MTTPEQEIKFEISFPPDVFIAMKVIGLDGERLEAELKMAAAVDLFKRGLLSIGKAAELAGIPLADFMDKLIREGIPVSNYTSEELQKDLEVLKKIK